MFKRFSLTLLLFIAGTFAWGADGQVATITNPIDGAEMVLVPAGECLIGTSEEDFSAFLRHNSQLKREDFAAEMPQHKVLLDSYYIYKNEVTVAQYRKFCAATGYAMPTEPAWKWQDNQPIVNVSWDDAKAYASWAGASLPTEAQWEKAARGIDGNVYPWGYAWDVGKARCSTVAFNDAQQPAAVGSYPAGTSPYGCMDMAGNVWEWCDDLYAADYYRNSPAANPTGPTKGSTRVLRGGSWGDYNSSNFRSSFRPSREPSSRYNDCGFRCVPLPAPKINPKDNAAMLWVPGGTFTMGSADGVGETNEHPAHQVTLTGYWIYKYDVTVAQYRAFCAATKHKLPHFPQPMVDTQRISIKL
ncbi:MAG: SUMF1/EgtB/PvdO family nonheme iron enzyme [bacterium]